MVSGFLKNRASFFLHHGRLAILLLLACLIYNSLHIIEHQTEDSSCIICLMNLGSDQLLPLSASIVNAIIAPPYLVKGELSENIYKLPPSAFTARSPPVLSKIAL